MGELYSRPLSPEAKKKLAAFLETYLESMKTTEVDEKAEVAKKKAIEALQTDIDILVFVATMAMLFEMGDHVNRAMDRGESTQQIAKFLVETMEMARKIDKFGRPGGNPN